MVARGSLPSPGACRGWVAGPGCSDQVSACWVSSAVMRIML